MMTTKIVILGKAGEAINGKNAFIEVNGQRLYGEISLDIDFPKDDVATATIKMILPKIVYRDE